jgi:hypothetical protein
MRGTQHGVAIERSAKGTTITFPTGHAVKLPPDAGPQIVHDPKVSGKAAPKKSVPPAESPAEDPTPHAE